MSLVGATAFSVAAAPGTASEAQPVSFQDDASDDDDGLLELLVEDEDGNPRDGAVFEILELDDDDGLDDDGLDDDDNGADDGDDADDDGVGASGDDDGDGAVSSLPSTGQGGNGGASSSAILLLFGAISLVALTAAYAWRQQRTS